MSGHSRDVASAYGAAAVTANDSTVIPTTRGLLVGTAGDLPVRFADGTIVTLKATAGYNPVQVNKVYSTGLTAADIVALY